MNDWAARPRDSIYAAVFLGAIVVKARDGQVGDRLFYVTTCVTLNGESDNLGLRPGVVSTALARSLNRVPAHEPGGRRRRRRRPAAD